MEYTNKPWSFFKEEADKLLKKYPKITPGEVKTQLEEKYGKMGWNMDRGVPKEGEDLYDYKFKAKGVNKKTGLKNPFQWERISTKQGRDKKSQKGRAEAGDRQTLGEPDFPKSGGGLESHHVRGLKLYDTLFDGLNSKDSDALTQWFTDNKIPLGHKLGNAFVLPEGPHHEVHNFMDDKGYNKFNVPDFKGKSLQERIEWAKNNFVEWDKKTTAKTQELMQKYAKENPKQYKKFYPETEQALALTEYANKKYNTAKYRFNKVVDKTNRNGINFNGKEGNGRNKKGLVTKLDGLRRADSGINLALQLAQGNYGGAAVSATALTAGEILKSKAGQKRIATQVAKIAAKQGGKQALKLIPGLDIYISGREAWDYLSRGRFDQAGIAALSGAIGWIPGIGDAGSALLDLTNTGISLSRGDYDLLADTDTNNKSSKGRTKVVRRTKL